MNIFDLVTLTSSLSVKLREGLKEKVVQTACPRKFERTLIV